ncbi:MAG TPA: hypothetical protein VFU22_22665 [Roseiflexaceae bacterium]|nr:hypothetical protein [Roseiflexaceae bacterium]
MKRAHSPSPSRGKSKPKDRASSKGSKGEKRERAQSLDTNDSTKKTKAVSPIPQTANRPQLLRQSSELDGRPRESQREKRGRQPANDVDNVETNEQAVKLAKADTKNTPESGDRSHNARTRPGSAILEPIGADDMRGRQEPKSSDQIRSLDEHRQFLIQLAENKLNIPKYDALYAAAFDLIRFRSNPPFLLDKARSEIVTYIRSGKHPFWKHMPILTRKGLVTRTPYTKKEIEKGKAAHLGLYPNTMTAQMTSKALKHEVGNVASKSKPGGDLYDKQLTYKTACLKYVAKDFSADYIKVGEYNDYPCLMVQLDLKKVLSNLGMLQEGAGVPENIQKGFTLFAMSFYSGLVNRLTDEAGLNIFITQRQSFGYATPSIAETVGSFRVNLGLMPPAYLDIHIQALNILNKTISDVFSADNRLTRRQADRITNYDSYNPDNAAVNTINDWRKFAFAQLEKGSKKNSAIASVTRTQAQLDYVHAQTYEAIFKEGKTLETSAKEAFEQSLQNILKGFEVKGTAITSKNPDPQSTTYKRVNHTTTPEHVKNDLDNQFADLVRAYKSNLDDFTNSSATTFKSINQETLQTIDIYFKDLINRLNPNNNDIAELYDVINDYLVVYSLLTIINNHESRLSDSSTEPAVEFDYGSESEAEDDPEQDEPSNAEAQEKRLKIKKITTHNGMRSLLSSLSAATQLILPVAEGKRKSSNAQKVDVDIQRTYYELEDAVKLDKNLKGKLAINHTPEAKIIFRDANAIVISGEAHEQTVLDELAAYKSKVWIIDTTSSTQQYMREIVDAFRNRQDAQLLLLVSSGFKNEQGGADKNSYGTVRVVADENTRSLRQGAPLNRAAEESEGSEDKHIIDQVLDIIKKTDNPLVDVAHEYRRLLKDLGFVPRNKEIIAKPSSADDEI